MRGLGLEGKSVFVTGSASGIGAAVVDRMLEEGASVAAFDRARTAPREHAQKRFVAHVGDVTRQEDVDAGLDLALRSFGTLDGVVHCAGITADGVVWKLDDEQWRSVIDVNLTGSFRVVRAAVPMLRKAGGGSIVLVSSVNGLRGRFGQANYAASKAGVVALAKSVAHEAGAFGIRVNAVAPGLVRTAMTESLPSPFFEEALRETPLQRVGEPQDVADVILFLCSPLSRHVTGAVLRVDGGQCTGA
jgi:NAD(P)-dependent dehydrogenase (short-subunit alcohol dehydrogenase family)